MASATLGTQTEPSQEKHNSPRIPGGFRWLWSGQSISLIGSQLSTLSIQVIAVKNLHAGAMQMGLLTASQTIPYLLFSLFVGVLIDRISRRGLLIAADVVRFFTLLAAATLATTGHLTVPLLCGVVCFISTFNLIFDAALGALIPQLLDSDQRLTANSRLSITLAGSEVVGPGLAGYVEQVLSVTGAMFIDAATYLLSTLCIMLSRLTPSNVRDNLNLQNKSSSDIFSSVTDGVSFVFLHPTLRAFAIWSAVWNFSWSAVIAVLVLYATHTLMMSPASIGLAFAVGGLGGVLGSFAAPRLARRWSYYRVLISAPLIGACGGAILLSARTSHPVVSIALSLFLYNLGESTFGVNMQTCRQNATPARLMGRMDTTMRLCFKGMASLGALAGGFIGARFGIHATLIFGVSGLFLTAVGLKYSRLSELSRPQPALHH